MSENTSLHSRILLSAVIMTELVCGIEICKELDCLLIRRPAGIIFLEPGIDVSLRIIGIWFRGSQVDVCARLSSASSFVP